MNEGPFREWIRQHQERGYRAAFRVTGNHEDALDALQEACLKLYEHRHRIEPASVRGWLVRACTNGAIDQFRRRQARARCTEATPMRAPEPACPIEQGETHAVVLTALSALPERQREVVTLRIFEELSFVRIAEVLQVSQSSVKEHFRRGLAALRSLLAAGLLDTNR